MSSGNVSSDPLPKDIEWRPFHPPMPAQVSQLGRDAVKAVHLIPPPKFDAVEAAWAIPLAGLYGKLYALKIKATPVDGIPAEYLAIVLANVASNFEKLLSFGDYSAAQ